MIQAIAAITTPPIWHNSEVQLPPEGKYFVMHYADEPFTRLHLAICAPDGALYFLGHTLPERDGLPAYCWDSEPMPYNWRDFQPDESWTITVKHS